MPNKHKNRVNEYNTANVISTQKNELNEKKANRIAIKKKFTPIQSILHNLSYTQTATKKVKVPAMCDGTFDEF